MAMPSYHKKLLLLNEIIAEGIKLFRMLHQSEERLQEQLIKGDHLALVEAEKKRALIKKNITLLEEKRKSLVPEGVGMQGYITTMIGKSSQAELLTGLAVIREELQKIKVLNEVNSVLLDERLRFSKELQGFLLANRLTYNEKGKLKNGEEGPSQNLDRNC